MTRGKYTARAAQGRAEAAALQADRAAQKLTEEQSAHAAEVRGLKARIEALTSQLTREVKNLAAAEVKRIENEWAARLTAEEQRQYDAALKVFDRIGSSISNGANGRIHGIPGPSVQPLIMDLAELLRVPAGTAQQAARIGSDLPNPRTNRRARAGQFREMASRPPYYVTQRGK